MENQTPEEQNNATPDRNSNQDSREEPSDSQNQVVTAELISDNDRESIPVAKHIPLQPTRIYSLPPAFENLAAVGGAVGALVLGVWSVLGALLTPYAAINSLIGLLLGAWGLTSRRRTFAMVGMILCAVGIVMSLFDVSRAISILFANDPTL